MGKKAHQHIIPRFYQRYFSHKKHDKDFIWAHEFQQEPKEISIYDAGVKRHAYSTKKTFKSEYDTGNEDALADVEALISPLYEKIVLARSVDTLTAEERLSFAAFIILMSERNPNNFAMTDQMMRDLQVQCWAEGMSKTTDAELREIFEKTKREHPDTYKGTTFEEAREWMIQGPKQENIVFTHSHGIANMWQAAITCAPFVANLDWQLLEPENKAPCFCTSDDPVVNMVRQGDNARIVKGGWGQPTLEVMFPLAPDLCFGASKGAQSGCHPASQEIIDAINETTVLQAYKYSYTHDLNLDITKHLELRNKIAPNFTEYESLAPKRPRPESGAATI